MTRFRLLCLFGLLTSLLIWVLPARFKPYHVRREADDYKTVLVERDIEWGFASDGFLLIHINRGFGGTPRQLIPVWQEWIHYTSRMNDRWPTSSMRPHYDEWGPIRFKRDDGVQVTQMGSIWCVPYSVVAIVFALPLSWHLIFRRRAVGPPLRINP